MDNRIKVLWICHFSNSHFREVLPCDLPLTERLLRLFFKNHDVYEGSDYAQWNINAIKEFEKFEDIELHVACPVKFLNNNIFEIEENGIFFHFFRDESTSLRCRIHERLFKKRQYQYVHNRKLIKVISDKVNPQVVHIIGAENPHYSLSALDIPQSIPLITQLQTLVNDPVFENNFPMSKFKYKLICSVEKIVIRRSSYVGASAINYLKYIKEKIDNNKKFLPIKLAIGPMIDYSSVETNCDLVYFAASIEKAFDYALDAFIIAKKSSPSIRLKVIGGCSDAFRTKMLEIIEKERLLDSIEFVGRLPKYCDVLNQVKHSRCALLPLKVDIISSTIREAMALGVPVVSTITEGTPLLNEDRNSILLSPIGDAEAMADNIIKILSDDSLYNEIRNNGYRTIEERYSNSAYMNEWRDSYKKILKEYDRN